MELTTENIDEINFNTNSIEANVKTFFSKISVTYKPLPPNFIGWSDYSWEAPKDEALNIQIKLLEDYGEWYSIIDSIISKFNPNRKAELNSLYEKNKSILELREKIWKEDKDKFRDDFLKNLALQKSVLSGIKTLIGEKGYSELKNDGYINLKSEIVVMKQTVSRIDDNINDILQKMESLGRITINNINNNSVKTGNINIVNETIIKMIKPDLDKELNALEKTLKNSTENDNIKIIKELIKEVLESKNPNFEWLKEKLSKIITNGSKISLAMGELIKLGRTFGII